ncbi:MAG: DUF1259 domain-containing protein [Chloroflexi bacterium]|nr:DUF1259 domain-containing protein [Chloroflexota bacterium]
MAHIIRSAPRRALLVGGTLLPLLLGLTACGGSDNEKNGVPAPTRVAPVVQPLALVVRPPASATWDDVGRVFGQEVAPVMTRLVQGGLTVTALHNHLLEMSPHVMYLHYEERGSATGLGYNGLGDAVAMAKALRYALAASGTPVGNTSAGRAVPAAPLDTATIEKILFGHRGKLAGGVFTVSIARPGTIIEMGTTLPPTMGTGMAFNFQPLGAGTAAVTGDFVLREIEVPYVLKALIDHGIAVEALHNHALRDQPHLFYMHVWGMGDARTLAYGIQAGLDQIDHLQGLNGA